MMMWKADRLAGLFAIGTWDGRRGTLRPKVSMRKSSLFIPQREPTREQLLAYLKGYGEGFRDGVAYRERRKLKRVKKRHELRSGTGFEEIERDALSPSPHHR
jgi:hypothetical protein